MNKSSSEFDKVLQYLKRPGVLALAIILLVILCSCLSPFFLNEEQCKTAKIQLIITGMGALGTCFTVWLALMMTYWRRFIERPELAMDVSRDLPFCMLLQDSTDEFNEGKSRVVDICGKVFNKSKVIATDSQVICKGVYVYSADMKSVDEFRKLRPIAFPWVVSQVKPERMDISSSLERYFKFAEISYPPRETRNGEVIDDVRSDGPAMTEVSVKAVTDNPRASIVIFIPGDEGLGTKLRIPDYYSNRSILLNISVSCMGDSPKNYGIRLDWTGIDPSDFSKPSLFSVQRVEEPDLLNLIGAGK